MSDRFVKNLLESLQKKTVSPSAADALSIFYHSYKKTAKNHGYPDDLCETIFCRFLTLLEEQLRAPYPFEPFHKAIRKPFDYYRYGVDFVKPLIDLKNSSIEGLDNLKEIQKKIEAGENVVLLANHQTEADPQAISTMLEKDFPKLAEEIIFVAGERVTTDPLAAPFSMGCNLLCIYSKRYIDHPPEQKLKKQLHNKKTMELMSQLLKDGGKIIYVAPSGGRDRLNSQGIVEVAPFDAQSIEMFYLMAKKSKTSTHFYPLALATYSLLPPPETIQIPLGEERKAGGGAIHLGFAPKIDMDNFPGHEIENKHDRRQVRADWILEQVKLYYKKLGKP